MSNEFLHRFRLGATVLALLAAALPTAQAQQAIGHGDVLTGRLSSVRGHANGKRVNTFQLVSEPRRLPPPNGLCGLETGPEIFHIVTSSDAQATQLKPFVGKELSVKVDEVACAEAAGEFSEAVVTKWSVVTKR